MYRILFYLRYAARNLRRSGRWTTFAVFCIAAGVATVVALRGLGLSIGDALDENVRVSNHGDITILSEHAGRSPFQFSVSGLGNTEADFTEAELKGLDQWASDHGGQMTAYITSSTTQIAAMGATTIGRPQFISTFLVDPQTFPPTGDILTQDPAGQPLRTLLAQANTVVISRNLADSQGIKVGDTVRVTGAEQPFTVTGIVATETEANPRDIFSAFFGFAYLNINEAAALQIPTTPNVVSLTLTNGADIAAAETDLRNQFPEFRGQITGVPELLKQNAELTDLIGRFIVIMGLGALLIGGVGIINTMLVMVGRRTTEIATLKTFGLKGRQLSAMFIAEAFLLGVIGSAVGCVAGVLMTGLVNQYGAAFLQQQLHWRIYPEALAYGMGLGLVVTLVFGILPVLTANRVRPAIILRPNETHLAGVGVLHSLFVLLLVVLVIGAIAGKILGNMTIGIIAVAATLLILGILVCLLWVVIWAVSHFPAFGVVDVRLALRNLTSRRIRTATTLLALSAGMFALSSITFIGIGTREIMQFAISKELGGNVLVLPLAGLLSDQLGQRLLNQQIAKLTGVTYNTHLSTYDASVDKVDGHDAQINIPSVVPRNGAAQRFANTPSIPVIIRESNNPDLSGGTLEAGRDLTPDDRGKQVLVMSDGVFTQMLGIHVGSMVTLKINGQSRDFEVVGLLGSSSGFNFGGKGYYAPPGSMGNIRPVFSFNVLQVEPEHLNEALLALGGSPLNVALDISFIDGLLKRLIDQFSAIPTLVGLLSLLAAAVTMANTVSLATLERRRQIGILKAIGLKGRRVLRIMLLENTVVGLLGGLIGIGLSALGVAIMTSQSIGQTIPVPRDATPTAIALIVASVVIAWVATFLSARVAVGERVTNVLRYE